MYNYVNKVNVAAKQDKSEVVINFVQESPCFDHAQFDEENKTITEAKIVSETIANIVVSGDFAREIAHIILKTIDE